MRKPAVTLGGELFQTRRWEFWLCRSYLLTREGKPSVAVSFHNGARAARCVDEVSGSANPPEAES